MGHTSADPARGRQVRSVIAAGLIVISAVVTVVGAVSLYLRAQILDSGSFADRAVVAVHKPPVRDVVAREVVVQPIERGSNNWADVFPPRKSPNLPQLKRSFILARAEQCRAQRDRMPNLILTDFYDSGDVISAVRELNGLGGEPAAPTVGA